MKKYIVAAVLLTVISFQYSVVSACTNFLVGKDASADGSTIISYAADSYGMYGFLHFAPAADYPEGTMRAVKDWDTGRDLGQIPQVAHTYSVVGNTNEHQVTIGETTWGGREALWDTVGVDYGSLIYIALERSKTAREAIEWMITLVNEYGYASEGESFSIGDPNEVWIMDLIGKGPGKKGANWVAVRIPDNAIAGHANQARITTLPQGKAKLTKEQKRLEKKLNCVCHGDWMWDKDLIAFAREKGYFTGADKDFSFQAAYNPFDFSGLYVCEARVWSFFRHFSDDMDRYFDYASGKTFRESNGKDEGEHMPLWIIPNRKVSVQDIKECMRDEYKGTPLDITQGTDAGPWNSKLRYGGLGFKCAVNGTDTLQYWYERPTATQQTAWSFVSQMRSYNRYGIFWFGVDDASCSCYTPMYSCINHVPECFAEGNGDSYTYSPTSAWWTFNIVANWAYTKYSRMYPHIRELQQAWDDKFNVQTEGIDAQVANLSDEEARAFLTSYSCSQAENLVADWQRLGIYLMTKFLDGQERKEENGDFKRNPYGQSCGPNRLPLPEPFLKMVAPEITHE
ncbi:MAG: C69 family dipeptidase [Paludibacteraceae bacterium]|nr:C69 family dipeptidase [Paludibacteraceae bacterium]MBQ2190095.1 C69 family dipeptidase [Paludibacteraceae bacterium]MBQ2520556.1 C69 family dipeptidase [Paludibacteraceae bacterium]MBQ5378872.1 C69 family dipeptidase [Paludibacteraceae bacterium]